MYPRARSVLQHYSARLDLHSEWPPPWWGIEDIVSSLSGFGMGDSIDIWNAPKEEYLDCNHGLIMLWTMLTKPYLWRSWRGSQRWESVLLGGFACFDPWFRYLKAARDVLFSRGGVLIVFVSFVTVPLESANEAFLTIFSIFSYSLSLCGCPSMGRIFQIFGLLGEAKHLSLGVRVTNKGRITICAKGTKINQCCGV